MAKSAPRFKWKFTYVRGWEGHRLGERIVKPERDYPEYAVKLSVTPYSVERRWRWSVERNYDAYGKLMPDGIEHGWVAYGDSVEDARKRAMSEAEAAYVLWWAGK